MVAVVGAQHWLFHRRSLSCHSDLGTNDWSNSYMTTVPDMLAEAAELYKTKNALYGNSYKKTGMLLKILFPEGIELKTIDDFNRFSIFTLILGKITRYNNHWNDTDVEDTLTDLSVYAMMLNELDGGMNNDHIP
jgi:hypothetical protein